MSEYVITNNAYPVTRYTTEVYDANGDNIPFTDLENRAKWFASMYGQLGFYCIGSSTSSGTFSNYSLVSMNASGGLTPINNTSVIPENSVVGIIYLLNEMSIPLWKDLSTYYYPVVLASDFLSLPIGKIGNTMFESSSWLLPSSASRNWDEFKPGDYLYYDNDSKKIVAFPITVTIPSSYNLLTDSQGKKIRLGKVVAVTNTNYIIKFNPTEMYGSGIAFLNAHSSLLDISEQSTTEVSSWINSHAGYRPKIVKVSPKITNAVTGNVIGLDVSGNYGVFQGAGIVVGVLASSDDVYSYIMVSGLWDSDVWGTLPTNLSIGDTDVGKLIWAEETSGQATLTPPINISKTIIPIGRVISPTKIFIMPVNGFNSYIEMLSNIINGQNAPTGNSSALEVQQSFQGLETTDITGNGNAIDNLKLRRIRTDSSVHITPLTQTTGDLGATNHWFSITENSWFNDCLVDFFKVITENIDTEFLSGDTLHDIKLQSLLSSVSYYVGAQVFQTNDLSPTYYTDQSINFWWWAGANGSYRLGWHPWVDAQNMNLAGIVYDSTAKTLTLNASGNSSVYIWHSAKMLNDMNWVNQLPWVGIMMLVHDTGSENKMLLFSYEGYEGFDTPTMTFNKVNIYTKNHSNLIKNPTWTANVSGSEWTEYSTTTNWLMTNFPIGGIRLKILGQGTFSRISNKPPFNLKWSALKKGGTSVLGSIDSSTSGQLDWDTTNDVSAMFYELTRKDALQSSYATLDYTGGGDIITLSAHPTVIHFATYHPSGFDRTTYSATGISDTMTVCNSANTDLAMNIEYDINGYSAIQNTAYQKNWMYMSFTASSNPMKKLCTSADYYKNQIRGTIIKFNLSGFANDYYGIIATATTINVTTGGSGYIAIPTSYGLTGGPYTVTSYRFYSISDDIVYKPSYIIDDNAQELWVDISKKHNYRAFSLMFEIVNVKSSSMLEIAPGNSHFNNRKTYLKDITVGCNIYNNITEGDKIVTYIQNRNSAPIF
jgi:hypothetical protein